MKQKPILKPIGHKQPKEKHLTYEKINQIIDAIIRDEGLEEEDRQFIWMGLRTAKDYYEWKR